MLSDRAHEDAPAPVAVVAEKKPEEIITVDQVVILGELKIIADIVECLKALQELLQLEEPCEAVLSTRDAVVFACSVIADAGMKLKDAENRAIAVLKEFNANKATYLEHMEKVGHSFQKIYVSDKNIHVWRKLAMLLEVLHEFTAKDMAKDTDGNVKKKADGTYPHVSWPDLYFKTATRGVSKYSLVYNYGVAAKHISAAVAAFESRPSSTPRLC